MFENIMIDGHIYATRFIVSWLKAGGTLNKPDDFTKFEDWLKSLELSKEDIRCIKFLATNGKLELKEDAKRFLNENT